MTKLAIYGLAILAKALLVDIRIKLLQLIKIENNLPYIIMTTSRQKTAVE